MGTSWDELFTQQSALENDICKHSVKTYLLILMYSLIHVFPTWFWLVIAELWIMYPDSISNRPRHLYYTDSLFIASTVVMVLQPEDPLDCRSLVWTRDASRPMATTLQQRLMRLGGQQEAYADADRCWKCSIRAGWFTAPYCRSVGFRIASWNPLSFTVLCCCVHTPRTYLLNLNWPKVLKTIPNT